MEQADLELRDLPLLLVAGIKGIFQSGEQGGLFLEVRMSQLPWKHHSSFPGSPVCSWLREK